MPGDAAPRGLMGISAAPPACAAALPLTPLLLLPLNCLPALPLSPWQVHGRRRDGADEDEIRFGVTKEVMYARNRPPVEGAQWTGIVTQVGARCVVFVGRLGRGVRFQSGVPRLRCRDQRGLPALHCTALHCTAALERGWCAAVPHRCTTDSHRDAGGGQGVVLSYCAAYAVPLCTAVPQIAIEMLESGKVDAVVCVQSDENDRFTPKPVSGRQL